MKSYFAIQKSNCFSGGWGSCIQWAQESLQDNSAPIQILIARAGEKKARVIAEITLEGIRMIRQGRSMDVKRLMNHV